MFLADPIRSPATIPASTHAAFNSNLNLHNGHCHCCASIHGATAVQQTTCCHRRGSSIHCALPLLVVLVQAIGNLAWGSPHVLVRDTLTSSADMKIFVSSVSDSEAPDAWYILIKTASKLNMGCLGDRIRHKISAEQNIVSGCLVALLQGSENVSLLFF